MRIELGAYLDTRLASVVLAEGFVGDDLKELDQLNTIGELSSNILNLDAALSQVGVHPANTRRFRID
jgi:hypothetical protein